MLLPTSVLKKEILVCQSNPSPGYFLATMHPILGPLYFQLFSDFFGISDNSLLATVFSVDEVNSKNLAFHELVTQSLSSHTPSSAICESRAFKQLALNADSTPALFWNWCQRATWVLFPNVNGPQYMVYMQDHQENAEEVQVAWTSNPAFATHWLDSEKEQAAFAMTFGGSCALTSLEQAETDFSSRPLLPQSSINHALEADVALGLFRVSCALLSPDRLMLQRAFFHAAQAGVQMVTCPWGSPHCVSRHLTNTHELLEQALIAVQIAKRFYRFEKSVQ